VFNRRRRAYKEDDDSYRDFESPKDELKRKVKDSLSSTTAHSNQQTALDKMQKMEELRRRKEYEKTV
jgi:hypothetical protein